MKTRKEYAADFDTSVDYVRFWNELSGVQRNQARSMFSPVIDQDDWVYMIGTDGSLLARRSLFAPTHGGPRPGAGRKHLDGTPPRGDAADQSERHTITMPASMWEVVKDAGGGVYSVGLRIIVEEWEKLRSRSNY